MTAANITKQNNTKGFTIFDLITAHTPISAQSSNSDYNQCIFCLLVYKGICFGYPFELHRLVDAIQMSTKNICFYKENQKKTHTQKHHISTVLALTVKIRKSQDFLAPISGSHGDQIFSLTFRNLTSIFLNSHLWSKTAILKLNNT